MASRNLKNGTSPLPSPHSRPLPEQQALNHFLDHDLEPSRNYSSAQLTHVESEGETTSRQVAAWPAAALLNPKAAMTSQKSSPVPSPNPSRLPSNGPNHTNNIAAQVAFSFSTPNDTPAFGAYTPRPSVTPDPTGTPRSSTPNGMSSMIERVNNVQDRGSAPVPKRRRIEEDSDGQGSQNGFSNGSSGMLSEYVKQKQQNGQAAPSATSQTVDLTGGNGAPPSRAYLVQGCDANCS